jgi:peptidoglycan/LPS O-acetylase OafA/YrhL
MRIACFDPLRALLAWWVVGIHVLWLSGFGVGGAGDWPVGGFIVMSGLCIRLLLEGHQETYRLFILRRACRLFPVYLVALGCALLVWLFVPLPSIYEPALLSSERHFFLFHLLAHLSLLHGIVPQIWLPHASSALLAPA